MQVMESRSNRSRETLTFTKESLFFCNFESCFANHSIFLESVTAAQSPARVSKCKREASRAPALTFLVRELGESQQQQTVLRQFDPNSIPDVHNFQHSPLHQRRLESRSREQKSVIFSRKDVQVSGADEQALKRDGD